MIDYERLTLHDGNCYVITKGCVVKTAKSVMDEDWKTALARGYGSIPEGTELVVSGICRNFYGIFIECYYNNIHYYINPRDLYYVSKEG